MHQIKIMQFQQKKNSADEDDSETDQGFVLNKIEIKQNNQNIPIYASNFRPIDFLPRYIISEKLLKKQLPDSNNYFEHIHEEDVKNRLEEIVNRKRGKEVIQHPFERYFSSSQYRLVYERDMKNNISLCSLNDNYAKNQIILTNIANYNYDHYSLLKNFEKFVPKSADVQFDSKFQCGNLALAYQNLLQPHNYHLFMQNDTNTKGYNRWFYFSIKNAKAGVRYKFSIVNFRKKFNFFNEGLKPVTYSQKKFEHTGQGWSRNASNVKFQKSFLSNSSDELANDYYTLSFQITFEYSNDINMLAIALPYSYTKLMLFLDKVKCDTLLSQFIQFNLSTVAYSISNNQVPYLTITSKNSKPNIEKKAVLILARQHPGQTWSSYFIQSIIRDLVYHQNQSNSWLLDNFIFKIFPMVNVDGVIYGNFRCDITGIDLNRNWKNPIKQLHPQIWGIKDEIIKINNQFGIAVCLDLHGHSKDYNIFAYSCKTDNETCRVLPFMISQLNEMFDFRSCTFGISKDKQSTARAVINSMTKNVNTLTIESSFYGYKNHFKKILFEPSHFNKMAQSLILALQQYLSFSHQRIQAEQLVHNKIGQFIQYSKLLGIDSGSDSDPQCDQIELKQKIGKIFPKSLKIEGLQQHKEKDIIEKKKKKKKVQIIQSIASESQQKSKINRIVQQTPQILIKQGKEKIGKGINKNISLNYQRPKKRKEFQNLLSVPFQKVGEKEKAATTQREQKSNHKQLIQLNDSIQLSKRNKNKIILPEYHSTRDSKTTTKFQFNYKYQKKQDDDFPLLCILSDAKRQIHLQKIRRAKEIKPLTTHQPALERIRYQQPTLIIHRTLHNIQKLKQHQRDSNELLSAIWRQNIARERNNRGKNVFCGGF